MTGKEKRRRQEQEGTDKVKDKQVEIQETDEGKGGRDWGSYRQETGLCPEPGDKRRVTGKGNEDDRKQEETESKYVRKSKDNRSVDMRQ